MDNSCLLDNDVVVKISAFVLAQEFMSVLDVKGLIPTALKVATFVIRDRIRRSRRLTDPDRAMHAFDHLSSSILVVEPMAEEIELAAAYEAQAQELDLQLDSGESQLLAILVFRGCRLLLTGDKRAIVAIEQIVGHAFAHPRLACLEQVVAAIVAATNVAYVRSHVCEEPAADRAMSICFSCAATAVSVEAAVEGLNSHINDLRSRAARTLLASNDLSGLGT